MNEAIKARWVEALRSGKYTQGYSYLNSDGKFCCLGVLCDLAAQDGIGEWRSGPTPITKSFLGSHETLPSEVTSWANLPDNNPDVDITDELTGDTLPLAEINDMGYVFEDIADLIEHQL